MSYIHVYMETTLAVLWSKMTIQARTKTIKGISLLQSASLECASWFIFYSRKCIQSCILSVLAHQRNRDHVPVYQTHLKCKGKKTQTENLISIWSGFMCLLQFNFRCFLNQLENSEKSASVVQGRT